MKLDIKIVLHRNAIYSDSSKQVGFSQSPGFRPSWGNLLEQEDRETPCEG